MAADQRPHLHVTDKLDIAGTALGHGGAERMQRCTAFAKLDPIDLQLFAHLCLKANDRLNRQARPQRAHRRAQLVKATLVTALGDLTVQHARRYPVWLRRRLPLPQIGLVWRQLAWPLCLAFVFRHRLQCQVPPYRVQPHSAADSSHACSITEFPNTPRRVWLLRKAAFFSNRCISFQSLLCVSFQLST